jgi:hypothetical protein
MFGIGILFIIFISCLAYDYKIRSLFLKVNFVRASSLMTWWSGISSASSMAYNFISAALVGLYCQSEQR